MLLPETFNDDVKVALLSIVIPDTFNDDNKLVVPDTYNDEEIETVLIKLELPDTFNVDNNVVLFLKVVLFETLKLLFKSKVAIYWLSVSNGALI